MADPISLAVLGAITAVPILYEKFDSWAYPYAEKQKRADELQASLKSQKLVDEQAAKDAEDFANKTKESEKVPAEEPTDKDQVKEERPVTAPTPDIISYFQQQKYGPNINHGAITEDENLTRKRFADYYSGEHIAAGRHRHGYAKVKVPENKLNRHQLRARFTHNVSEMHPEERDIHTANELKKKIEQIEKIKANFWKKHNEKKKH